jgi:hypothetical protein
VGPQDGRQALEVDGVVDGMEAEAAEMMMMTLPRHTHDIPRRTTRSHGHINHLGRDNNSRVGNLGSGQEPRRVRQRGTSREIEETTELTPGILEVVRVGLVEAGRIQIVGMLEWGPREVLALRVVDLVMKALGLGERRDDDSCEAAYQGPF